MWIWTQKAGRMLRNSVPKSAGYSGAGEGRNNPLLQNVPQVGPIPVGAYSIGPEIESETHGPVSMHLIPLPGSELFGRSGFMIHGDNASSTASHGCIILPRATREEIAQSHDRLLVVIPELPDWAYGQKRIA